MTRNQGLGLLEILLATLAGGIILYQVYRFAVIMHRDWRQISNELGDLQSWQLALSRIKCAHTQNAECTAPMSLFDETGQTIVDATASPSVTGAVIRADCLSGSVYLSIERAAPTSTKRLSEIPVCTVNP